MHTHELPSLFYFILLASFGFCRAVSRNIIVDQTGNGNFKTVQAAIDSVPSGNSRWVVIQINPGTYIEKVIIPGDKGFISLKGSGIKQTIISFYGHGETNETATFSVFADNFVAKAITFRNTFDRKITDGAAGPVIHQAIAVGAHGDKISFHKCAFISIQDTLWDAQGRHYYEGCYIQGLTDFIWGNGQSVFEGCSIYVYKLPAPTPSNGYITAQGRETSSGPGGFVFIGGSINGGGIALLGRAYRAYSRVIFIGTTMSAAVNPLGWDAWNYKGQEQNLLYVEAKCTGAGANLNKRVSWERKNPPDQELAPFSRENFIDRDGWIGKQPNI